MVGDDSVISGMQVSTLLESLLGIGKAHARKMMNRLGIAESELVRELSAGQRTALGNEQSLMTALVSSTPGRDYEVEDYGERIAPEEMPRNGEGYGIEDWNRP